MKFSEPKNPMFEPVIVDERTIAQFARCHIYKLNLPLLRCRTIDDGERVSGIGNGNQIGYVMCPLR